MKIKICGITSYKDAIDAIHLGADALGFVFYKKSPRYIEPHNAQKIIKKLPPFVHTVALFVNENAETINEIVSLTGASLAQLHFEVSSTLTDKLQVPYLHVVRAKTQEDLLLYKDNYRLVDAFTPKYGGSGKKINLEWFNTLDCSKIILAGGLTAQNVSLVKKYGFYGVDVSSATEKSYGVKDKEKMAEFIQNAR